MTAGALAGNLPDILDVDGPVMPNWAWSGYLAPLDIDESILEKFLAGPKGYWDEKLYSIGLWDAAVAMITRRSTLEEFDIWIPTLEEPWTLEEFDAALVKVKDSDKFDYPLNLGLAWTGEWYPYAFSPFLQSFGGDLVDRSTYQTVDGVLNGEAAIEFGEWWQSLFERDLAPAPVRIRPIATQVFSTASMPLPGMATGPHYKPSKHSVTISCSCHLLTLAKVQ